MGGMPRPVGQPGTPGQMPSLGIPAQRQLALNPRTQPMARPMPGRPMTDSSGRVIGGGQPPANRFMPGPMGPGMQPGRQPGGPSIGFGMPPGQLPGNVGPGFGPTPTQPDGAPTDTPPGVGITLPVEGRNPGLALPPHVSMGFGGMSGGKGGFGPMSMNAPMPAGAGQGSPFESGAQFSQNT